MIRKKIIINEYLLPFNHKHQHLLKLDQSVALIKKKHYGDSMFSSMIQTLFFCWFIPWFILYFALCSMSQHYSIYSLNESDYQIAQEGKTTRKGAFALCFIEAWWEYFWNFYFPFVITGHFE